MTPLVTRHAVELVVYFTVVVPAACVALGAHWYASRPGGCYQQWSERRDVRGQRR